jgi:hypothetical protein
MDLNSLRSGEATFNPFTALIGLESTAADRRLSLAVPVIEESLYAKYSILFHELAHLWSMRTTMLGAVLSAAAAKAWTCWNRSSDVVVELPERVFGLLGAWLPILEGLAIYAELDFTGDENRDAIHSPVLKVIHYTGPAWNGVPNDREFRFVRYSRVVEDRLLANLMFEADFHPSEHAYLTGYLYVKAMAQRLAQLCPRLARPARMLPLLIRLLCDHSVILDWRTKELSVEQMLGTVHRFACSLDVKTLTLIADWIEKGKPGDVVGRFDYLDMEATVTAGALVFREPTNAWYEDLNDDEIVVLGQLRGAGSFYLASWKSGTLVGVGENSLTLRSEEVDTEYVAFSAVDLEKFNTPGPMLALALDMHQYVRDKLRESIGHEVTAGLYVDLASGDPGMVFWKDESLLIPSPYSLSPLTKGPEVSKRFSENLGVSLAMSPNLRHRFGKAIRTQDSYWVAAAAASRWHLSQLISSPRLQERVMQNKLRTIDNGIHLADCFSWCLPKDPRPGGGLSAATLAAYDRVFDFPGFGSNHGLTFKTLLPDFEVTW